MNGKRNSRQQLLWLYAHLFINGESTCRIAISSFDLYPEESLHILPPSVHATDMEVTFLKHPLQGVPIMLKKVRSSLLGLAVAGAALVAPIAAQAAEAVDTVIIIICDATSCLIIIVQ